MSGDNDADDVCYEFDEVDQTVITIAKKLIRKVLISRLLNADERHVVLMISMKLAELPKIPRKFNATLSIIGPKRRFGDHEIYHYWSVEIEDEETRIGAGGHFYRPSTGGDSFTTFRWVANPGYETECQDFSASLRIVDDAKPFGTEIEELDLSEPGYSFSVTLDGEDVGKDDELEDEDDDDDDEEVEDVENDGTENSELTRGELCVCLWGFLDADMQLIYAVAGRVYRLSGDDEQKLKTLRELSRHDFRSTGRSRVPNRFTVNYSDGTQQKGFATPQAVNDPNAMLFDELMKELEKNLPPLADFAGETELHQKLPDEPLSARTIVYEDAQGNCRAIIDAEDRAWLTRQMKQGPG